MRKITILLSVLLLSSVTLFAQKSYRFMGWKLQKDVPVNEVKINLPVTIFCSYPEVSYERILNDDISVGGALGVALQEDRYPVKFAFNPYFRWFFGGNSKSKDKYGSGFFIEANGGLLISNYGYDDYSYINENGDKVYTNENGTSNDFGAGLGLALGWKYLSKNNWVGEVYFGGGRDFLNDGGYPRMGISIGKRF